LGFVEGSYSYCKHEHSYSVSKSIYEGVNYKLVLYLKRYLKIKMINYSTKTNTSKHLNLKAKFL